MKKVNIILHIVSLAAIVVLFVMLLTQKECSNNIEVPSNTQATTSSEGIVYIQLDSLINQYDMYNDLKTEFEGKYAAIESDLTKRGRALENDFQSFNEKMQKGLLTRSQAEAQGSELQMREQEYAAYTQQKQMELAEEESVMINRVMDAINTYVKEFNKSRNYSLILTTTAATNVVIDGSSTLDITSEIVAGLNQEYVKSRGKK